MSPRRLLGRVEAPIIGWRAFGIVDGQLDCVIGGYRHGAPADWRWRRVTQALCCEAPGGARTLSDDGRIPCERGRCGLYAYRRPEQALRLLSSAAAARVKVAAEVQLEGKVLEIETACGYEFRAERAEILRLIARSQHMAIAESVAERLGVPLLAEAGPLRVAQA